jgi:hypothetical protein
MSTTTPTTTRPPVTPSRDWETWLRGGEEKRHILCGDCNQPGARGRTVAYCGNVATGKAGKPVKGNEPDVCETCAIASAERMPCGPTCKRARR